MKNIKCPKCGEEIDIENLIQAGAKEALDKELNAQKKEYEKAIEKIKKEVQTSKEQAEKELENAVDSALKKQKEDFKKQEEKIRKEALEEQREAYNELNKELKEKSEKLKELNKLKAEKTRLEREKEEIEETLSAKFEEKLSKKLAEQRLLQQQQAEEKYEIKIKALEEQKEAYETLQKELKEKSEKLKELNKLKAEKTRLEREKEEIEETLSAKFEEKLSQKLAEQKQTQKQLAEEKYELQIKELQKQLDDQKKLTEEMKARQEQGSMQLQGEIQELAIEEYLRNNFKFDTVDEVGKGDMGADSLQTINTMSKQNCGKIYYESKRTKTFKEEWISKFKKDIQEVGADIGVLVTAIYPKDMTRMGLKDGIYICSYEEFKALSFVLRENIIRLSEVKNQQENKYEKSVLLYEYLTSTEFKFQLEAIVNAFISMQNDLASEKRAMNKLWKKREKEIEKVTMATTNMIGSLQGIAGNAIPQIPQLDMPLLEVKDNE